MSNNHVDKFDSLSAFVDKAENGKPNPIVRSRSSQRSSYNDWAGGSFGECVTLAKYGWATGAERIATMAAPLLEQISSKMYKPEMVADVEGGSTIDMGAFLAGEPECILIWRDSEEIIEHSGRFVKIVASISASCGFTTEQLFAKGAAVAILIDALEMSGHRVQLDIIQTVSPPYRHSSDQYMLQVRVKNFDDPLDMESIAFTCAHSGMLRRLTFSVEEQTPDEIVRRYEFDGGDYGSPVDPNSELCSELEPDIYIGASSYDLIRDPVGWARQQLELQGVQFIDN
jgi:hypothetical protein